MAAEVKKTEGIPLGIPSGISSTRLRHLIVQGVLKSLLLSSEERRKNNVAYHTQVIQGNPNRGCLRSSLTSHNHTVEHALSLQTLKVLYSIEQEELPRLRNILGVIDQRSQGEPPKQPLLVTRNEDRTHVGNIPLLLASMKGCPCSLKGNCIAHGTHRSFL